MEKKHRSWKTQVQCTKKAHIKTKESKSYQQSFFLQKNNMDPAIPISKISATI